MDRTAPVLVAGVGLVYAVNLLTIVAVVQRERRLGDPSPWSWIFILGVFGVFGALWWFRHDERRG